MVLGWLAGIVGACRQAAPPAPAELVAHEVPGPASTKILPPTTAETARIAQQLAVAEKIARERTSSDLRGTHADLQVLQRLVDGKALAPTQTYELQCLGLALGRVMANGSSLVWVTVEDDYGRDPALNVPGTAVLLFPLTMISKRVEQGREVPLAELYTATVTEAERQAAAERAARAPGSGP